MRKLIIVGIGTGNPEHLTIQAINALRTAQVIFVSDKGPQTAELTRVRKQLCDTYLAAGTYRVVEYAMPEREKCSDDYQGAVAAWHDERAGLYEQLLRAELAAGECGAFLVWGDPSLYDSILRIIAVVQARGHVLFDYEVIPGISSAQVLAARHRIPLNQVAEPILLTTGRRFADSLREGGPIGDALVMLDAHCAFTKLEDPDAEIYWGAYLGMPDEILISGKVSAVATEIQQARARAREQKGWIMDSYLVRPSRRRRP
jgi:precorrin-6A synthase